MTVTKKIIQHTGALKYGTLITRSLVEWTFYTRVCSRYALDMTSWSTSYELNASPRLVLKLMKVL